VTNPKRITAILIPRKYDVRLFDVPREEIIYGHTAWIGTADVAVNELGEANITGIAVLDGHRTLNIGTPVLSELRRAGVKMAVWTKVTGGKKRIVREIFRENCTADEILRFESVKDAERGTGTNIIKEPR
jgi:hypothetical protein